MAFISVSKLGLKLIYLIYANINIISIVILVISISMLFFFRFAVVAYNISLKIASLVRTLFIFLNIINFFFILFKFIIVLFFFKAWYFYFMVNLSDPRIFTDFVSIFSTSIFLNKIGLSILLLAYLTSYLTVLHLGDRDLFSRGNSVFYFFIFLLCTTLMVSTTNLLIIFLSFEFIFLPSIYFVYTLGYIKKTDKTVYYLLLWTLFGSFIVLSTAAYIYSRTSSLQLVLLLQFSFSSFEKKLIYLSFFVGFGTKMPIFPFHYWLTKVHVEAPAGFSMFLSGFLVKTAAYCFYVVNLIFYDLKTSILFIIWISFCIVEASIKMWVQVDLKKLVAFATIQEMNMILLLILLLRVVSSNIVLIFIVMHGLLSTLMFFLVDQIQKRAQTRHIFSLSGFGLKLPIFKFTVWAMLILFLGFPLTVKFVIEWHIGALLYFKLNIFGLLVFFAAMFFGSVGFMKCWLLVLYGTSNAPLKTLKYVDFLKKDLVFFNVLFLFLFSLNLFLFLF